MSNTRRQFTCYFCNQLIENETEMGHTTLCSKVLVPCPFKCGAYVERANLAKHKTECNNNFRRSASFDVKTIPSPTINIKSLDRNGIVAVNKLTQPRQNQDEILKLNRRIAQLEMNSSTSQDLNNRNMNFNSFFATFNSNIEELKANVKQQGQSIQKSNYFNGYMSEWKKNIDAQVVSLKNSLSVVEALKKDTSKQWAYIQERLIYMQNLQMDLSFLKETVFKENAYFKKTEGELTRNLKEIRSTFNKQNESFENMWHEQTGVIQNIILDIQGVRQSFDEQKAKYAGLVFDVRSVSQISSEAAEKIEIIEREFNIMRQDVNQMKVNMEILEDLASNDNVSYKTLIWRVTEVESKLKRARENDIVLKSPIFYTERYGYKIRVFLYINGLKKWKDRYALACIHVLKGEYDPLLTWPCTIEGTITVRNLMDPSQTKNFSKYIKTKRSSGDEDEEEPQESSPTYIFIPHRVLFKESYIKDDTFFLDITINDTSLKHETSL